MASEAERLQAKQLFLGGKSVPAIASDMGVSRSTVHDWRHKYDWDLALAEQSNRIERNRTEAEQEAARAEGRGMVLSHNRRREICWEIAEDRNADPRARLKALEVDAKLDADTREVEAANGPGGGVTYLPTPSPKWADECKGGQP